MFGLISEIFIKFECNIYTAGYILEGDSRNLRPKYDSNTRIRTFDAEAVRDFLAIGNPNEMKFGEIDDDRLRFCEKWGPLIHNGENGALFDKTLSNLWEAEEARKQPKRPELTLALNQTQWDWEISKDGVLIPVLKPLSLSQALLVCWSLMTKTPFDVETKVCKFFQHYGPRTNCTKYFENTRGNKKFCSDGCRDAFAKKRGK